MVVLYRSILITSLIPLLTIHLYAQTIECHIKINIRSDNVVHPSHLNIKRGLITRLVTLLTNYSYMLKAIGCHKMHLQSSITNKDKVLLGISDYLHHKDEKIDVGTQNMDNKNLS